MTTITMKCQLRGCKHFIGPVGPKADPGWICDAFPLGIPLSIVNGANLHTSPVNGDGGIQFATGGQTYKRLVGRHDQNRHGLRYGDQANAAQLGARARSAKRRADIKADKDALAAWKRRQSKRKPANPTDSEAK